VDYEWWTTSTPLEEPLADNPDPELRDPWNWKNGRLRWTSANGGTLQMNGTWDKWFRGEAGKISINWDYQIALENLWDRMTPQTTRMQVDFGSTTYNWDIMQDTHPDPAPNQPSAGDAEVAKLCFHAGLSVEMSYGFGLSMPRADTLGALKSYFRYDSDAASSYWGTASMEDVREEIRWLRPVLFDACGDAGCHTWIIYGYKEATDQFMMNFGWDNGSDGWYTHDSIDCLGNDGKPDFDRDQVHHTRIAPRDVVRFVGGSDPGDGSPDDPHQSIDEALAGCPDGSTLIFKAGSTHTLTGGSKVIDQPVTLKGYDVTIQ